MIAGRNEHEDAGFFKSLKCVPECVHRVVTGPFVFKHVTGEQQSIGVPLKTKRNKPLQKARLVVLQDFSLAGRQPAKGITEMKVSGMDQA